MNTENTDFRTAVENFKRATRELDAAWAYVGSAEIADYPKYLPSFDEFAADVSLIDAVTQDEDEDETTDDLRWTVTEDDDDYPSALRNLENPPEILYGYGNRDALADLNQNETVAIVGTQRATAYGREVAYDLAQSLRTNGRRLVSGMKLGIDGAAIRGVLQSGGSPIVVLAGGADVASPRSHRLLHEQIAASGCVLSCKPFGAKANDETDDEDSYNAARLVASLAGAAVYVEGEKNNPAGLVLGLCFENGGTPFAVPGPVTSPASAGPNACLANDTRILRDVSDLRDFAPLNR